jgi:molecular chaperone DnaK
MQAASQQMYQQAGPQPGPDAGQQAQQDAPKQDDTIQDADFEEVK